MSGDRAAISWSPQSNTEEDAGPDGGEETENEHGYRQPSEARLIEALFCRTVLLRMEVIICGWVSIRTFISVHNLALLPLLRIL
jgi:hypothetical protein